jgi:hypothetical protein
VLGHAPAAVVTGRIVEDAEQDGRIGGEMAGEPVLVESEAEGDELHEPPPERGHGVHPLEDGGPQLRRFRGEEVGTVERPTASYPRVVGPDLGAEVEALLAIGHA